MEGEDRAGVDVGRLGPGLSFYRLSGLNLKGNPPDPKRLITELTNHQVGRGQRLFSV